MITDENIELILNDIVEHYGYDFTQYSKASLRRRILRLYVLDKFPSFAELRHRILNDRDYLQRFIEEITVNVTEMFRDPYFYKALRTEIFPLLATNPYIKIWHAGCSTGEEVFSMAILLKELNLLHKSLIYATDINPGVLENLSKGIFPLSQLKQYSENYIAAGGSGEFSSYYTAKYDKAIFNHDLLENMVHSTHNLVSDGSFNEFNLILCRNVLIYFDPPLQNRVLGLFDDSLSRLGYLCLGTKESLRFSPISPKYQQHNKEKIWKKIK
ncbi:MAG: CheR family methyltransferase [Bacteroidia bacterium]